MHRNALILRALQATGIVAAIGAVGGAIGGFAIAAGVMVHDVFFFEGRSGGTLDNLVTFFQISGITMSFGALYGVVLGPLYAWTMLRRAPLWRAIGETAAAAAVGFGFGLFNHWMYSELVLPVLFSFAAAARLHVELRWRARRRPIRGERLSRRRGYRVTAEPERLPSSRPAC